MYSREFILNKGKFLIKENIKKQLKQKYFRHWCLKNF